MTAFYVTLAAVAGCGLLWLLAQLGRVAAAPRLLALLGLLAFWAMSWPFGVIANSGSGTLGLDRLDARTVEHVLRLVATACLVAFVLATPVARPATAPASARARRTVGAAWWWQVAILLVAVAGLAVDAELTPTGLRDELAAMANGSAVSGAGPVSSTPVALFFLIENVYYLGAFAIATVWATRHLRRPLPPALRQGLRVLRLGSVVLVAATSVLTVSVLIRWAGISPPAALNGVGLVLLGAGLLAVVLGLAVPAVASAAAALRIVRENRATARELEPLWSQLREVFPHEDGGPHAPGGGEAVGGSSYTASADHAAAPPVAAWLSRRYYRRLIDCRDGLHQLGPYLQAVARDGQGGADLPTGAQLLAALELRRGGTYDHDGEPVVPVAGRDDATIGFADDVQVLVVLSRRLAAAQRSASHPATAPWQRRPPATTRPGRV
ncbi:MAB_1171c family putative transporter [Pseudonocardia sp. N23]|uniref:MAB_1171c family putative transporter n=1 Tax=Pseudonocardia sp. N23 TaxID=1987376 RepID=UPI000BFB8585|nr:MAB_1171c family putative transporter [Pseudonocardia sp. N23]GAY10323.1 hypothetical protein TOK_4683 [Pseudonocardia sp. N23]